MTPMFTLLLFLSGWALALLLAGAFLFFLYMEGGEARNRAKYSHQMPPERSQASQCAETPDETVETLRTKIKREKKKKSKGEMGNRGNPYPIAPFAGARLVRYSMWYTTHKKAIRAYVQGKEQAGKMFGFQSLVLAVSTPKDKSLPSNYGGIEVLIHFYEKDYGQGSFPRHLLIKVRGPVLHDIIYGHISEILTRKNVYTMTIPMLKQQLRERGISTTHQQIQKATGQWYYFNIYLTGEHLPVDTTTSSLSPHA